MHVLTPKTRFEKILKECNKVFVARQFISKKFSFINGFAEIDNSVIGITVPPNSKYDERSCFLIHEFGHLLEHRNRLKNRNKNKRSWTDYGIEDRAWKFGIAYFGKKNLLPLNINKVAERCLTDYRRKLGGRLFYTVSTSNKKSLDSAVVF